MYLMEKIRLTMMSAVIGQKAPNLGVSEWVQGVPTNLDQEKDKIVLVEVFQVNCPGCFMHAIPEAINIYNKYKDDGVRVLGIATAFEDFDKNTLDNLKMLVETGEVIGETKNALSMYGQLKEGNKLPFKIPFPLGMDNLTKINGEVSQEQIMKFIYAQLPEFDSQPEDYKSQIIQRVKDHLMSKEYSAETFEKYQLQGTPSTILVDRKGILRDVSFGQSGHLDSMIQKLIAEG
jgi:thiol-disulfide isomerase/thioredoxin